MLWHRRTSSAAERRDAVIDAERRAREARTMRESAEFDDIIVRAVVDELRELRRQHRVTTAWTLFTRRTVV